MEYLNVGDVAKYLRRSKSSIYKLVMLRQIPYYKISGALLFKKVEIDQWVDSKRILNLEEQQYCARPVLKPRSRSE
jgi:excisionase family DNA binding protein